MTTLTPAEAASPHDLELLTRLANEFFNWVPGGSGLPSASSVPPAGTGVPPGGVPLAGFGATPTATPPFADVPGNVDIQNLLAPIFTNVSVPSATLPLLPPVGGFGAAGQLAPEIGSLGTLSSAIPGQAELHALLAPTLGVAPPAPQTAQNGAPDGTIPGTAAAPFAAFMPDVQALAAGLPGEAELRALLAPSLEPAAPHAVAATPNASPQFYFLEAPSGASQAANVAAGAHPAFDVALLRADFPILSETVNGRPLVWLDNAATTQKPRAVIERLAYFYEHENSNIHRAAHELAARATDAYDKAREAVRRFVGAASADNIVFVRGATEGINLVAKSWGRRHIRENDEIVITWLEHHANIVPWQQLAGEVGARLRVAPVDDRGQVRLDDYEKLLNDRTKIVSISQVSNALGTIVPVHDMVRMARRYGAHVLVDGAQSVSHMPVQVQEIDCDWFVFSGHKMFAPTGIGAVYGRAEVWHATPPWQGGGNMIRDVTFEKSEFQDPPSRFEAGTGNIADAVGLGAAIEYLERVGMENIARYEHDLLQYGTRMLADIPGLRLIGTAAEKASVLSFVLRDVPPEMVGRALNEEGIAVRAGHHCAQPILRRFGVEATVRPSLAFYNTHAELDALAVAVRRIAAQAA
jgi:cysteine desulfurase/selenocysteine lyase